jgi:hypothetical protein
MLKKVGNGSPWQSVGYQTSNAIAIMAANLQMNVRERQFQKGATLIYTQ